MSFLNSYTQPPDSLQFCLGGKMTPHRPAPARTECAFFMQVVCTRVHPVAQVIFPINKSAIMAYALGFPKDVTDRIYSMRDFRWEMVRDGGKTPSASCFEMDPPCKDWEPGWDITQNMVPGKSYIIPCPQLPQYHAGGQYGSDTLRINVSNCEEHPDKVCPWFRDTEFRYEKWCGSINVWEHTPTGHTPNGRVSRGSAFTVVKSFRPSVPRTPSHSTWSDGSTHSRNKPADLFWQCEPCLPNNE